MGVDNSSSIVQSVVSNLTKTYSIVKSSKLFLVLPGVCFQELVIACFETCFILKKDLLQFSKSKVQAFTLWKIGCSLFLRVISNELSNTVVLFPKSDSNSTDDIWFNLSLLYNQSALRYDVIELVKGGAIAVNLKD